MPDKNESNEFPEDKQEKIPFYKVIPSPIENIKYEKKHGKPRAFKTPEALWEKAVEYFEYQNGAPILEKDFKGKDAITVYYERALPYTINGFCLFAGTSLNYLRQIKSNHKPGSKYYEDWKEYLTIVACIEEVCYKQKFEGATAGVFNPNIIARDLGLFDEAASDKGQDLVATLERLADGLPE